MKMSLNGFLADRDFALMIFRHRSGFIPNRERKMVAMLLGIQENGYPRPGGPCPLALVARSVGLREAVALMRAENAVKAMLKASAGQYC